MTPGNKTERREFIKQSAYASLGLLMLPGKKKAAPSDRVRVAHIGLGGMGLNHLKWFQALPEAEIVALCDLDQSHLAEAHKTLLNLQPDSKPDTYNDFRKLLERKDIDAITCATPDHWHAQVAILAFEAGKDVYGEKPLSYNIREGQKMLKSLNKHDRIFQLGTQIHAGENYHRVTEIIQSGKLGKIHTVRMWKTGEPPILNAAQVQDPPVHLNWDYWLGGAPYTGYTPDRCHFTYRYFLDYSGGIYQDFWCHIADIVWWSLQPKGLKSIVSRGEKSGGVGDTPRWLEVDYEFDQLKIYWTSVPPAVQGAAGKHIGAYFEGEHGTLLCDYTTREITINGQVMKDLEEVPKSIERSKGHQQNFLDAVKSRKQPQSNLAYAREMTLPMHLGLISWRLGRKLEWNSKKEKCMQDSEANALLKRKNRKPWNWT
ncbi:MAG: Gfo/Idh/MocA family oxidoreductase [Saprospiraceae bacterium]|nr:Gfo/Idh/MocA family oxidoreductase [Saprospiraceae bacterium]